MFGCFFRFIKLILVLVLLLGIAGAWYYYTKVRPEAAPWKDGVAKVQDKVQTAKLAAEVKAAISLRQSLNGLDISVDAERDVVTVRGKVASAEVSKTVEQVAASVPGVRQVVNFLEIDARVATGTSSGDDRSVGERVDDEALELKIRAAFKLDKALSALAVEVQARRRVVTLTAPAATAEQRKRALEVARSVEGVVSAELR